MSAGSINEMRHVIDRLDIALTFESEREAFAEQAAMSSSLSPRLLEVIEQVFDDVSDPSRVVRIEALTLDLGRVGYQGYEDALAERLEVELRRWLEGELDRASYGDDQNLRIESRAENDLALLVYFLRQGSLPWNHGSATVAELDRLLEQTLLLHGPDLLTAMRRSSSLSRVAARMISHFRWSVVRQVLTSINPATERVAERLSSDQRRSAAVAGVAGVDEASRRSAADDLLRVELLVATVQLGPGTGETELFDAVATAVDTKAALAAGRPGEEWGHEAAPETGVDGQRPDRAYLPDLGTTAATGTIDIEGIDTDTIEAGAVGTGPIDAGTDDTGTSDIAAANERVRGLDETSGPELAGEADRAGVVDRSRDFGADVIDRTGGSEQAGVRLTAEELLELIERLLPHDPDRLEALLRPLLVDEPVVDALAASLSEPMLLRVLELMAPAEHRVAMETAEILVDGFVTIVDPVGSSDRPSSLDALKWRSLLWYAAIAGARPPGEDRSSQIAALVHRLFGELATRTPDRSEQRLRLELAQLIEGDTTTEIGAEDKARVEDEVGASDEARVEDEVGAQGKARVEDEVGASDEVGVEDEVGAEGEVRVDEQQRRLIADALRSESVEAFDPPLGLPDTSGGTATGETTDGRSVVETSLGADLVDRQVAVEPVVEDRSSGTYITNAGLVLAAPYLPRLFEVVGLLEGRSFRDRTAAERGVHLLQYLVDKSSQPPEYLLSLNKILCGIPLADPISRSIELLDEERETVDSLIRGMIENWASIGNTSIDGFRESFLQREGRLQRTDSGWDLLVEERAFDMLLDSLPWSFSTIGFSWMDQSLLVSWR